MKNIKAFETQELYNNFKNSENYITPNVLLIGNNIIEFNKFEIPKLIVKYIVDFEAQNPIQLYMYMNSEQAAEIGINETSIGVNIFSKIEIDGIEVSISDIDLAEGKYQLSVGEHTIEYSLKDPTSIGKLTFINCSRISEIIVPNRVTNLDGIYIEGSDIPYMGPLAGLGWVTSITLPNSIIRIGDGTFLSDSELRYINIPNSITKIGKYCFAGCQSLTNINIPNTVTIIDDGAFNTCTGLTNINIPNGVTYIGESAFVNCTGLTNINIPSGITDIKKLTFGGCIQLTSINIPNGVTYIGEHAFYMCQNLLSVIVNATTPPTLGENAFDDNASGRKIYVPTDSVEIYKTANGWSNYANDIEAISNI